MDMRIMHTYTLNVNYKGINIQKNRNIWIILRAEAQVDQKKGEH